MERVPVEIWQQILVKVMESNDVPIFATSCTPYTFLCFVDLHIRDDRDRVPYGDNLEQRKRLRPVCRAWNEFVLSTSHRWLRLEDTSEKHALDLETVIRAKGGVGPVEKLSTKIYSRDLLMTLILPWVSHILKRPASQSPLRTYILHLNTAPVQVYNPFDDLVGKTTTQNPDYTNTTLRSLSIVTSSTLSVLISLSQISRTFTGLHSLFLHEPKVLPQQTLSLAHLEVLYVYFSDLELETLQESMETWDTPALRHVYLGRFSVPLTGVVDRFLGRYARQIESLVLSQHKTHPLSLLDLPSGFWAQFTALRLLGVDYWTLEREEWSGWSIVPPPTHPCRYLVCRCQSRSVIFPSQMQSLVNAIRPRWTWHDGVRLVAGNRQRRSYWVMKNIQDDPLDGDMEWNEGILPEL